VEGLRNPDGQRSTIHVTGHLGGFEQFILSALEIQPNASFHNENVFDLWPFGLVKSYISAHCPWLQQLVSEVHEGQILRK